MNIIVVGCSQVGVALALSLFKHGHEVAIIDRDSKHFLNLPNYFTGLTVEGIAMDMTVLEKAGVRQCDALAAVTEEDNLNIVVSQLAVMKYHVKKVVARVVDPQRESVFENMGLTTICPTKIEEASIFNMLTDEKFDSIVDFGSNKAKFSTRKNPHWTGKMICDVPVFKGEIVYAVVDKSGAVSLSDDPERIIEEGDMLVFSSLAD